MTPLAWEKWHPYLLALIGAVAWYWFEPTFPKGDDILSASLSVGAILVGFLATAKSLLMTLDTPVLQRLAAAGYIKDIASYMREGIYSLFAYCAWSMLGFFVGTKCLWFGIVWIFLIVAGSFNFLRVTQILLKLFEKKESK
jgi:hypothetical protein